MVLEQYDYTIMNISGERKCWGDLLSLWVNVWAMAGRAVAVFVGSALDDTMPSKDSIHEVQQQARAGLGAMVSGAFTTPVGRATKDNEEDLFGVGLDGRDVLWIPEQTKGNADAAHDVHSHEGRWVPGVVTTLQRLQGYCSWFCMNVHVTKFVKPCLQCMD